MALTKADMAERLFDDLGLNKREAKEMVETFFEEVRNALETGEQVKLSGFGNFDLRAAAIRANNRPALICLDCPMNRRQLKVFGEFNGRVSKPEHVGDTCLS